MIYHKINADIHLWLYNNVTNLHPFQASNKSEHESRW